MLLKNEMPAYYAADHGSAGAGGQHDAGAVSLVATAETTEYQTVRQRLRENGVNVDIPPL